MDVFLTFLSLVCGFWGWGEGHEHHNCRMDEGREREGGEGVRGKSGEGGEGRNKNECR